MTTERPAWLNGQPYYCEVCGAGGPERMACEMPDCRLESEEAARRRADRAAGRKEAQ